MQRLSELLASFVRDRRGNFATMFIVLSVPLFLADHEAVEDGTSLQQAGGRMKKKLTKDQKYVHKIMATSSDDALKGKATSWSNLWLR